MLSLLFPVLVFCVVGLLSPASWVLRFFLGFGLLGPVKGSIAAWMQSYFFGAAVGSGSWFAFLQAAGMSSLPTWAAFVINAPLAIAGGLLAKLLG